MQSLVGFHVNESAELEPDEIDTIVRFECYDEGVDIIQSFLDPPMRGKRLLYFITTILLASTVVLVAGMIHYTSQPPTRPSRMELLLQKEAELLLSNPRYAQQFIRTGPPAERYNCHGWTFAMGRRSVDQEEVHSLLHGSRYTKVSIPMPGDVVIYYDRSDEICHSGIVKASGPRNFVLVESKWGDAGRFIHMVSIPQAQARYEYYRRNVSNMRRPTAPSGVDRRPIIIPQPAS